MTEKLVVLLDPSSGSTNLGDEIIRDSIEHIINRFSNNNVRIIRISVHQRISKAQERLLDKANLILASGSNLLNFRYIPFREGRWKTSFRNLRSLRNVVLFGVGWSSYTDNSTMLGRLLYKNILSSNINHSVRDEFTKSMLSKFGVENVLNTSCPTMWRLTEDHLSAIPREAAESVVFTLTDYAPNPDADKILIGALKNKYSNLYFWPQGSRDFNYFQSISPIHVDVVGPSLSAYDELLKSEGSIDYVGTRLHGGIRALQKRRRALIISIDNRASEVARDTNLPIIGRNEIQNIGRALEDYSLEHFKIPRERIDAWKHQLTELLR